VSNSPHNIALLYQVYVNFNWEKGKKQKAYLQEKIEASVFIESVHQWWWKLPHHWRPLAHERNSILTCTDKQHTIHDPWEPEQYNYTMKRLTMLFWITLLHHYYVYSKILYEVYVYESAIHIPIFNVITYKRVIVKATSQSIPTAQL